MSFKSLHAAPYFIPLDSPLLDVTTLGTYRVVSYFIPLGSPLLDVTTLGTHRVVPYFIPLGSPLLDVTTLETYRVTPYFIPLGSPLLWRGWGRSPYDLRHSLGVCPICFLKNLENWACEAKPCSYAISWMVFCVVRSWQASASASVWSMIHLGDLPDIRCATCDR